LGVIKPRNNGVVPKDKMLFLQAEVQKRSLKYAQALNLVLKFVLLFAATFCIVFCVQEDRRHTDLDN
jgi:large-conductance mechanosensitive channel